MTRTTGMARRSRFLLVLSAAVSELLFVVMRNPSVHILILSLKLSLHAFTNNRPLNAPATRREDFRDPSVSSRIHARFGIAISARTILPVRSDKRGCAPSVNTTSLQGGTRAHLLPERRKARLVPVLHCERIQRGNSLCDKQFVPPEYSSAVRSADHAVSSVR